MAVLKVRLYMGFLVGYSNSCTPWALLNGIPPSVIECFSSHLNEALRDSWSQL